MSKFIKLLGVSLVLALSLSACSEQVVTKENASPEVNKKVEEIAGTTSSNATEPVVADKEPVVVEEPVVNAKVGETLNVNGIKITVADITKYDGKVNQFQPLTEDHAVKINVIIENTTAENILVSSYDFKMYDVDGFELAQALGDEMSLTADVPSGKKAKGVVLFDVPAQEGVWELHFEEMLSLSGDSAIWELEAK